VCAIVSAPAAALHYAHERSDAKGKPLNIVHARRLAFERADRLRRLVKVVDFGIAKATLRHGRDASAA
jgi:hypothetical protein